MQAYLGWEGDIVGPATWGSSFILALVMLITIPRPLLYEQGDTLDLQTDTATSSQCTSMFVSIVVGCIKGLLLRWMHLVVRSVEELTVVGEVVFKIPGFHENNHLFDASIKFVEVFSNVF